MARLHRTVGSVWTRWDLHLHAPGTKLSNHFGAPTDEALNKYVDILEASDVMVFSITTSINIYYLKNKIN